MEISVSLPLDPSGFLRRECPSCAREFKWFYGDTDNAPEDFLDPENYFCPYCGVTANSDDWWTSAQQEYVEKAATGPASRYLMDELERTLGRYFKVTGSSDSHHEPPDPLVEPDDMVMVEPPCHPFKPLKIADDWSEPLHCLVCGSPFRL
jgi:hypothetical protein